MSEGCVSEAKRVSIHAPAGGATDDYEVFSHIAIVSIHAPAGGATVLLNLNSITLNVSIHAPAGGATTLCRRSRGRFGSFNPRARRGRDRC